MLPCIALTLNSRLGPVAGWALYLGNSLVWGVALYSVIAFITHYAERVLASHLETSNQTLQPTSARFVSSLFDDLKS